MTKYDFIKKAKEYGYSDEDIDGFIQDVEESGIKYDDIVLIEQPKY